MASKTRYGFQLFALALHNGTSRATHDFIDGTLIRDGPTFLTSFQSQLASLEGKTRTGVLSYRDSTSSGADESDTKPSIRIIRATPATSNRVDFEFRYGRVGSHDVAIAANEADDAELKDKASTNIYRASLYLPTSGTQAILVVENRGNVCPSDYLLKHLSFSSREFDPTLDPNRTSGWWRLMAKGITDTGRLEEILLQGKGAALQLEKHGSRGDGRRRTSDIVLRQNGLPLGRMPQLKALVLDWMGVSDPDPQAIGASPGTSVEQVAALIDINVSTDQFDDGAVVYDDGNGRTQTIRPHTTREIFIYPLSEGSPPLSSEIRVAAEQRIRGLMGTLQIQIVT
ncbi:MAG: hypothetical protein JWQ43_2543 [Glaciihabitans sp.]|nr:hypothetical protein [Glaciihabitans sp.]